MTSAVCQLLVVLVSLRIESFACIFDLLMHLINARLAERCQFHLVRKQTEINLLSGIGNQSRIWPVFPLHHLISRADLPRPSCRTASSDGAGNEAIIAPAAKKSIGQRQQLHRHQLVQVFAISCLSSGTRMFCTVYACTCFGGSATGVLPYWVLITAIRLVKECFKGSRHIFLHQRCRGLRYPLLMPSCHLARVPPYSELVTAGGVFPEGATLSNSSGSVRLPSLPRTLIETVRTVSAL